MSKKTKRLEKENLNLTRKQEATNKNIFQMAEERSQSQQAIDKLTRENEKLKKLCRAMQNGGYGAAQAEPGAELDELEGETESEYEDEEYDEDEEGEYDDDTEDDGIDVRSNPAPAAHPGSHPAGHPAGPLAGVKQVPQAYGPPPPPHQDIIPAAPAPNGKAKAPQPLVNGTVNGARH